MISIIQQNIGNSAVRVKKIHLELGQLASVDQAALLFSFQVAKQGTIADNAELCIINIPAKGICESCQQQVAIAQYYDICSQCGHHVIDLVQGEEVRIKSMEVA